MAEGGIFAEDIVKNAQGNVGVVLEDAEETTDESDSDEEALKKGQIVVCWYPSGNEETISISKVKLADRALLPGDVVKFSDVDQGTQKGFVSNVEVAASVKVLVANQIFHNLDCKELSPLQHFIIGAHVSLGPWLGTVTEVYRRVVIMLKNGSRCAIEGPAGEQSSMLFDMSDQRDEDCPFYSPLFYPGQRLTGSARAFKEAKWLSGVKPILNNQSHIKGTVEEVSVIACEVDWQVCGAWQQGCNGDECLKPPDLTVTQEQLPRLLVVNHFRHANLQVGDKAFYTVKAHDLRYISNGESLLKEQTDDNDNTEHAYTSTTSDSQVEGCGIHEVQPVKTCRGKTLDERGDFEGSCLRRFEESTESFVPESDSKTSSGSTSASSLCEANPAVNTTSELPSTDKRQSMSNLTETGDGTNQIDTNDGHHTAGSDSADADEDSDGGETVTPKAKASGSFKHESGSSHVVRYPTKRRKKRLRRKRKAAPPLKVNIGDRVCVEVTNTSTTVDVIWQDGSKQDKILSTDVTPVFHLDELEFFPGDFISDKRENADPSIYGVVLTADHKSRMCHVKWFSREGQELRDERDVSVYDITEHTDFVFSAGDVVVRVAKGDSDGTAAEGGDRPIPCVGQVTLVDEEGSVFIKWVDKTLSKVKPQELYKIDAEDDGHLSTDGSTVESEDEWETASGESEDDEDLAVDIMDLAAAAAGEGGDITADQAGHTTDEGAENVDREALQDARNRMNEILSNSNPPFMTFDSVPESHTYKYSTFQAQNPGRFLSCMRKEMALLTFSLPAGIIVRGYEDRVDILRVMITGPVDTPYEHGLFVFDVRLPSDYPASPPLFHYLSQCSGRLNPNLYEDGKVCVSLLGTWAGRGSEVWTSKSNVLQVLVSIQGLILCSEPYYNEAGYEKQRGTVEGRENSRLYNEMVLLKLVQSMERLLRNPPAGLENEILKHFAHHGARMIRKFKRWIALFHEQATAVPGCDAEKTTNDEVKVNELEEKGPRSENENVCMSGTSNADTIQAKVVSSCIREECVQAHAMSGELLTNDEVHHTESCSNGVCKDDSDQSAVLPEGKPSNVEPQGACQGAMTSEKNVPDYPLFPLSRGFCLSLVRALDSFEAALEKAQLPDCSE